MFENYQEDSSNSKNTFWTVPIPADRNVLGVYDLKDRLIAFSWHVGDSITFVFDTDGTITCEDGTSYDAETYFTKLLMHFKFSIENMYTREIVFSITEKASTHFEYKFTAEDSAKTFTKGLYRVVLELTDNADTQITQCYLNVEDLYIY